MGSNAALIEKLVEAKEGSRALSKGVLRALGYRMTADGKGWMAANGSRISQKSDPSRNLQDAVDCVPEGLYWSIGWHTSTGDLLAKSVLWPPGPGPGPNEG